MRWLVLVLTAVGLGFSFGPGASLWTTAQDKQPRQSGPTAEHGEPKTTKIYASGIVEGAQRDVSLRFEATGRLAAMQVRVGDYVRKGDVLASLDAELWQTRLAVWQAKQTKAEAELERLENGARPETRKVALAEVRRAEVRVKRARDHFERLQELHNRKIIATEAFSERKWDLSAATAEWQLAVDRAAEISASARIDDVQIAHAEISSARAGVAEAQAMLKRTQLIAPSDGLILHVETEPGQIVGLNDATPCLTMVDVGQFHVRAFVEEFDAIAVSPGQRAYVTTDAKSGHKFFGRVISCAPYMQPKRLFSNKPDERVDTKVREVLIVLENSEELVVGLPVDVFIESKQSLHKEATPQSTGPSGSPQPQAVAPLAVRR